jgi:hypothetical protein
MAKKNSSSGIGLPMVLFIVFLVLKLTDNIDWSWWWVTSPLWIPVGLVLSIGVVAFLIVIFALMFGFSITEIRDAAEAYKNKHTKNKEEN